MNTIRRSDAIDALIKAYPYINPSSITDVIMGVEDAEPQRMRGHWIYERADMYRCSECEHIHTSFDLDKCDADFCPNCGADNREVEHEQKT